MNYEILTALTVLYLCIGLLLFILLMLYYYTGLETLFRRFDLSIKHTISLGACIGILIACLILWPREVIYVIYEEWDSVGQS